MNNNLKIALQNIYNNESAQYLVGSDAVFSPEFERGMERLLKGAGKSVRLSKALRIVVIAAAAAAVLCLGASAGAAMARGFVQEKGFSKEWKQPILSFSAADAEGCPDTIERFYLPSGLPEDYDRYDSGLNDEKTRFSAVYYYNLNAFKAGEVSNYSRVTFTQWTKAEFKRTYFAPDYVEVSETSVNGCPAYLLVEEHYFGSYVTIVWDNGDYIMEISCVCPVDEAMRIAEKIIS